MKILIAMLFSVLLVGCSGPVDVAPQVNGSINVSNTYGSAGVSLVTLADGTRCAVLVGSRTGSIDCDWSMTW